MWAIATTTFFFGPKQSKTILRENLGVTIQRSVTNVLNNLDRTFTKQVGDYHLAVRAAQPRKVLYCLLKSPVVNYMVQNVKYTDVIERSA